VPSSLASVKTDCVPLLGTQSSDMAQFRQEPTSGGGVVVRKPVAEPGSSRYREAVARWLRAAMRDAVGRDKMNVSELCKRGKIGRSSFYRIMRGVGDTEPETLLRLAAALKVPPPEVTMVLRLDAPESTLALPTLAKLKEAEALLREAIDALEATPARDAAARTHRAIDAGVHPRRRPKDDTG
jgi:hypothetical protein